MATESSRLSMLRPVFFLIVKILVFTLLGMHVRRKLLLSTKGPAIIVANHNSHLDTLALMSLFPLHCLSDVQPVAAADYFLKNKMFSWFAMSIIGIIPIKRISDPGKRLEVLNSCYAALEQGKILILFPEGTRGEAEQLAQFKKGVAHLAQQYPHVPVIPVFMHGFGKALPKGDWVLVPFFCDIFIGEGIYFSHDIKGFMDILSNRFQELAKEGNFAVWE